MSLIKQRTTRLLLGGLLLLPLTGCITTQRHAIPEGGLTLPELYRYATQQTPQVPTSSMQHTLTAQHQQFAHKHAPQSQPNYVGYTRTASNEINTLFRPRPNPSIPIYIYPHLTQMGDEMIPVPGYTSSFFLYKQNRYIAGSGY